MPLFDNLLMGAASRLLKRKKQNQPNQTLAPQMSIPKNQVMQFPGSPKTSSSLSIAPPPTPLKSKTSSIRGIAPAAPQTNQSMASLSDLGGRAPQSSPLQPIRPVSGPTPAPPNSLRSRTDALFSQRAAAEQPKPFSAPVTPRVSAPVPQPTPAPTPQPAQQQSPTEAFEASVASAESNQARPGLPAVPDISPDTLDAVSAAEKAFQQSLRISPEELSTQAELDNLMSSAQTGLQKIEDQPIAMNFITGKMRSLENRALNLAEPLERKLARLQAARLASSEASKFALDRADKRLDAERTKRQDLIDAQREAQKGEIREFGGQLIRVMPDGSSEVIADSPAAAEQFTLSPGQVRFDAQGNVVAQAAENIDPKEELQIQKLNLEIQKAQQELSGAGMQLSPIQLQDAVNKGYTSAAQMKLYAQLVAGGSNPPELRQPTETQSKARQFAVSAEEANNLLNSLNYDPGLIESSLVPNAFKSQARQQFEQAARAFVNSVLRRESGAVISDQEFLNKYEELIPRAGDGDAVKQQKAQARLNAVESIRAAGGSGFQTGISAQGLDTSNPEVQEALQQGYTIEQIMQFQSQQNPLTNVGADTNQGVSNMMRAIGLKESSGNYNSPRGADGEIGKYQIMPGNYAAWAREIGLNPADYSPQAQDAIAMHKIGQYMQKYGNDPVAVAIAWNAGPGRADEYVRTGQVPSLIGTSAGGAQFNVPNYVKGVLNNLS